MGRKNRWDPQECNNSMHVEFSISDLVCLPKYLVKVRNICGKNKGEGVSSHY